MAMTVGELVGYLDIRDKGWARGIATAGSQMAALGRSLNDDSSKASKALDKTTGALVGLVQAGGKMAALGGGVQTIGGIAGAAAAASGALLVLPAVMGAAVLATKTLEVATKGWSDAMGAMEDPAKFAAAVGKLAPEAQKAAYAVKGLQPAWKALQLDVQGKLFQDLGGHITKLGGTYIPILRGAMGGMAQDMNYAAQQLGFIFGRSENSKALEGALGNIRTAFQSLMQAVAPLGQVFIDVFSVGAEFLPGLVGGAGDAAWAFADMVRAMKESGQLHDIISNGLSVLGQLGQVLGNVGSIISGVFAAANVSGGGFLNNLIMITQGIADMVNSVAGQEALGTFFATTAQLADLFMQALQVLLPVLPSVITLLSQMALGAGTALVNVLTILAPIIQTIATYLAQHPALMAAVGTALAALVVGFQAFSAISGIVTTVGGVFGSTLGKMAMTAMSKALIMAASWIVAMGPIGWVIAAVVGLVVLIIANWDSVVAFTQAAWAQATGIIGAAWDAIVAFVNAGIAQAKSIFAWLGTLPGLVAGWFGGVVSSAAGKIGELIGWVAGIPGRILGALGNLGALLVNAGRNVIEGLWNGIRAMGSWLSSNILGFIRSFVPGPVLQFLGIASPSKLFKNKIGRYIPEGLAAGILGNARVAGDAAREMAAGTLAGAERALAGGSGSGLGVSIGDGGVAISRGPSAPATGGGGPSVSVTVVNPLPETGSDSINRSARTLALLGG